MSKLSQNIITLFRSPASKFNFSTPIRQLNRGQLISLWPTKPYSSDSTISSLPALDTLVNRVLENSRPYLPLKRTAIVYIHHALHSSIPVLQANFKLGLLPENTFVLDKHYSECKEVVKKTIELGVHYQPCSAQIGLGKFSHSFIRDINYLWYTIMNALIAKKGKTVDNLIVMDHRWSRLSIYSCSYFRKI